MAKKAKSKDKEQQADKKALVKVNINWHKLLLVWSPRVIAALLFIEIGYVMGLMPDWDQFIYGPVQK